MNKFLIWTLLLLPATATAGAWVQEPGHCYGKLWDRSMFGSGAYAATGLRDMLDVPSYQDHQLNIYAECGIHNRVTLLFSATPMGYASSGGKGTFYMGPLSLGSRIGLKTEGTFRFAAGARYSFAPAIGDAPLTQSNQAIYQPALENHFGELTIEGGAGFSLGSIPAFISTSLGARLQSAKGVDHALIGGIQFGITLIEHLQLMLNLHLYEPFFQPVEITNTAGIGQTRYLGFGLNASYWVMKSLALFFTLDGVFYAESNAATPALLFGLETKLKLW